MPAILHSMMAVNARSQSSFSLQLFLTTTQFWWCLETTWLLLNPSSYFLIGIGWSHLSFLWNSRFFIAVPFELLQNKQFLPFNCLSGAPSVLLFYLLKSLWKWQCPFWARPILSMSLLTPAYYYAIMALTANYFNSLRGDNRWDNSDNSNGYCMYAMSIFMQQ